MKKRFLFLLGVLPVLTVILAACGGGGDQVSACLITKTEDNPFFVKMREGAALEASSRGIQLTTAAGLRDGDAASQINAIEGCIASGVDGILITASNNTVNEALQNARDAGILVIALDTPLDPADAADATFATNNLIAGQLIGRWAAAALGADGVANARIALLDLNADNVSVDWQRDQGFLDGFGIDTGPNDMLNGDETDERIIGNGVTGGNPEGGLMALETLLQVDSNINVVYTINEPAAAGAYQALQARGLDTVANGGTVTIVSVDGGCAGVRDVDAGIIGATSMQFPLRMASLGIEAIAAWAADGTEPDDIDTGVMLVTDQPQSGVQSITSEEAMALCWG